MVTSQAKYSEQYILNNSYDEDYKSLVFQQFETPKATKITEVGSVTYVAEASVGSDQASAVWRCKKIDASVAGTTVITWADSGNFTQVATDLTALTYT